MLCAPLRYRAGDADRIFYSSGTLIRGSTRKGKEFLRFSTNVIEPIRSLAVEGDSIHTGGEFVYNEYISCKEAGFHMSNDKINEVVTAALSGAAKPDAILACQVRGTGGGVVRRTLVELWLAAAASYPVPTPRPHSHPTPRPSPPPRVPTPLWQDRCLRVLNGGKLLFEVSVDGPATAVERYHPNPAVGAAAGGQSGGRVIYGTEAGCVGEVHSEGGVLSLGWQINPALEGRRAKSAGVSCLHSEDITKDGVADIMVGREDGLVEVWSFDVGDTPKLAFERNLHESVTCIGCGAVSNSNFDEVVVSTYSGQIVAFSSEPGGVEVGAEVPAEGRKEASGKRVARLLAELDSLSAQVDKERAARRGGTAGRAATAAGTSDLKLRDKWTLCADEACYKLSLELAVPLEGVLLQCDVPVEMVETEAAGAIASLSPTPDGRPGLLVSFRCHEVTNRIELRMRTSEGRYGQLQAFVWPRISPKTCAVASYAIKPLSLHTRLAAPPPELPALSMLRIAGGFTVEQMHSWVAACLPEVPARLTGDTGSVAFRSTFLGTLLLCDYAKGEATFRSDSLTTLSIVKEVVSKEATARKVHIQINVDARQETVPELLRKIDPLMQ